MARKSVRGSLRSVERRLTEMSTAFVARKRAEEEAARRERNAEMLKRNPEDGALLREAANAYMAQRRRERNLNPYVTPDLCHSDLANMRERNFFQI